MDEDKLKAFLKRMQERERARQARERERDGEEAEHLRKVMRRFNNTGEEEKSG